MTLSKVLAVAAVVSARNHGHGRLISLHKAQTIYKITQSTITYKLVHLIQSIVINKMKMMPCIKFAKSP